MCLDCVFEYNYPGTVRGILFNADDEFFYGKIEGIDDLVSFESVEDYFAICKENGKKMEKSYKGSFYDRITPELHKKAILLAVMQGLSLNQFVQKAVEQEVLRETI